MRRPLLLLAALSPSPPPPPSPPSRPSGVGVDLAGIDKSAAPGDGFDQYANGGWRARNPIPADRRSIGAFLTAALLVEHRNNEIITVAGRNAPAPAATSARSPIITPPISTGR